MISPEGKGLFPPIAFGSEEPGYRHADLAPDSADLGKIAATLDALAKVRLPDGMKVRQAEQRYASYAGGKQDAFAGNTLCHTDLHKHNVLVGDEDAKLVDWAWPTMGAPWIDTACVILQLITEGHTPKDAEAWGEDIPAFRDAAEADVSLFVTALGNVWAEVSAAEPQKWKADVAGAASRWATYRGLI